MTPHFEQLSALAGLFAAETSIPLDDLGVVHANPSSAEAIFAAKESLVIEARATERIWGESLRRLAVTTVMLRDNLKDPPPGSEAIRAKWINPATPSIVSASDAVAKQVSALPWLADSQVILETLGYDDPTIMRLMADKNRAQGADALDQLLARAAGPPAAPAGPTATQPGGGDDPGAMKARADAMGVLIRSGVTPASAAAQAGMPEVEFIPGAMPVTIRTDT